MSSTAPQHPERLTPDPFPRPQMQRSKWMSLDGIWQFCSGRGIAAAHPEQVKWDSEIKVPFSPETPASGIDDCGFYTAVWYRRTWEQPQLPAGQRLLLHFEAVDWRATVWVNGRQVATHEGGYTPFSADITDVLRSDGPQEVVVRAEDDPADLAKPRGKQDWKLEPHSIWYPRTTGIWQTVWLETVPSTCIRTLQWTASLERWEISLEACIEMTGSAIALEIECERLVLSVRLAAAGHIIANDTYTVISGEVHRRIALSDPGIDDYRNALLWSPSSPTIIDAVVELRTAAGVVLDRVHSYTALRTVSTQGDRFLLNGRPLTLRLVLDQGYWPETGLTAPDDDALIRDILLVKAMGFNGVRKHQKIECQRFLYWADHLGLLVWEEMPSAYRYTTRSIQRLTREWLEVVQRDRSHPCIVTWVPFNESWGVPDLPLAPDQRHYVRSLYELTKALDPTRPVIGNDGWESVATDIIGIHDYDDNPERIGLRYGVTHVESRLFERERPGGRVLQLSEKDLICKQPIVLTEFGGIAFARNQTAVIDDGDVVPTPQTDDLANSLAPSSTSVRTAADVMSASSASALPTGRPAEVWGYSVSSTSGDLLKRYTALLEVVRALPALAGFCYTQFTDTYQEANGLLYADRTPKAPSDAIARATSGLLPDFDPQSQALWREQILKR